MGRDLRYVPPHSLQHVVDVTVQGRYLLCPSEEVNDRFLGVLGRAQVKYRMVICAVAVLSNHYHLLLRPRDGLHLASFMCFLKTNVAKEIGGRIRGWRGHFFDQRYHSTTVSDEESAQVQVLSYVLAQGTKEFLVDTVRQWPGVHSAVSLIHGSEMVGHWIDRSTLREPAAHAESALSEQGIVHSPIPCWEHLSENTWRLRIRDLVDEIDRRAAIGRRAQGKRSLGVAKVLAQHPFDSPATVEKSPQPRFHASSQEIAKTLYIALSLVTAAFRSAARKLRRGDHNVRFPEGTFPPSLPFVPFTDLPPGIRGRPA